ncbi:hypothetical protein [Moorena producens]|uniref:hypothetical protein n=1 Tax=Moorena producens TaxID=1155739 RepID=UPI000ACD5DE1|nr:hypothetical protein [Moorena producens]
MYIRFFPFCLLPLASCLLPLAFPSWEGLGVGSSCLLPLASCLPLLGGVRGGFLLPLASCLFPILNSTYNYN